MIIDSLVTVFHRILDFKTGLDFYPVFFLFHIPGINLANVTFYMWKKKNDTRAKIGEHLRSQELQPFIFFVPRCCFNVLWNFGIKNCIT